VKFSSLIFASLHKKSQSRTQSENWSSVMLCPKCGTEVGNVSELCTACKSSDEAPPLARIKLKQIRKEVTPEEREAYERQRAAYDEGHEDRVTFPAATSSTTKLSSRPQPFSNLTFFTCLLIIPCLILGAWYLFAQDTSDESLRDKYAYVPPLGDDSSQNIETVDSDGVLFLNNSEEKLTLTDVAYDPERSTLIVRFAHAVLKSPRLFIEYRFTAQSRLCDLANVQSIRAELITEIGVKHFRISAAEVNERNRLAGSLQNGKQVSGWMLHEDTISDAKGENVEVKWTISFKGILGELDF
jgi:hypothetical protein